MAEGDLAERLAALEERVARLERPATPGLAADDTERFWALVGLRERLGDAQGAVLFTGLTELPSGGRYSWQQGALTDALLDQDWADQAASFAALGHPVRLTLLRHILLGHRTIGELQELAELGTTGQLYHHLKQLLAAGWLQAAGRGRYEVPAGRVIPLLVFISAFAQPSTKDSPNE